MEKRLNLPRDEQIKCVKHVVVLHYGQNIATQPRWVYSCSLEQEISSGWCLKVLFLSHKLVVQYRETSGFICIGNHMIPSAIWNK